MNNGKKQETTRFNCKHDIKDQTKVWKKDYFRALAENAYSYSFERELGRDQFMQGIERKIIQESGWFLDRSYSWNTLQTSPLESEHKSRNESLNSQMTNLSQNQEVKPASIEN